jgi:MFS family permease
MVMAAVTAVTSFLAGWLTDAWSAGRTAALGLAVIVCGALTVVPLDPDWTVGDLLWRIALVGLGVGLFAGAQTAMALAATPRNLTETASGAISLFRQSAIGAAPSLATLGWGMAGYSVGGVRIDMIAACTVGVLALTALLTATRTRRTPPTIAAAESGRTTSAPVSSSECAASCPRAG